MARRPRIAPLSRGRFAARMTVFLLAAVCLDSAGLVVGAIGYHFLEGLDWLDAFLNAALVVTGNGPYREPLTFGGKLFSIFYAMFGVILFAAVISVLLAPLFQHMLRTFQKRRDRQLEEEIKEDIEEDIKEAGQMRSPSWRGRKELPGKNNTDGTIHP